MIRRNAFGTVLLTVGLVWSVLSATPNEAYAQFPGGYVPNGYMPDAYLPNGYGSTGIAIPGGFGSSGIAIPGGSCNDGIVWDGPGNDEEEEDPECDMFFMEEECAVYQPLPFPSGGGETSPDNVHRRAMDAMDDLFPWELSFPWEERLPWGNHPVDPMRK